MDAAKHTPVHPAKLVGGLYVLADLLIAADRVLDGTYGHRGIWRDLPKDREAELEKMLGGFDFLMTSKAVREYADAWQAELDAEDA